MKVFGIACGRKNGNSEILLKEAFKAIENNSDAETTFIRLQDADILSCTGCETCMKHHMSGDDDFRCIHNKEADHFFYIETCMREANAIIISTPVYNLMPPGIMIRMLNKLHSAGDYRRSVMMKPKVGAAISVGGTDWTNLGMPITNMTVAELCGGFGRVVDLLEVTSHPAVGLVAADEAILARAYKLGENVAEALKNPSKIEFKGERGICPLCHNKLLEFRRDGVFCPLCETKADIHTENGAVSVTFSDEQLSKSRWDRWGQELHIKNIGLGHKKAAENKAIIDAKRKEYAEYKQPLQLPNIE